MLHHFQGQWQCVSFPYSLSFPSRRSVAVSANLESTELSGRERRQLRNEKRAEKARNWRQDVEDMLLKLPKKKKVHWKEKINLDTLADLGPQWWMLRVSRPSQTPKLLAQAIATQYPATEFQIYTAAIQFKRILKNGNISVRTKSVYPGYIFLRCVLNREFHHFLKQYPGVWEFLGFKAGNTRTQILKPKPIPIDEVEAVMKRVKDEQKEADKAFEEEQQKHRMINFDKVNTVTTPDLDDVTMPLVDSKPKRKSRKKSDLKSENLPTRGSIVRIISGTFAEFSGSVKTLNRKTGKVTVGITVFGKESLVDLDINEIVAETN